LARCSSAAATAFRQFDGIESPLPSAGKTSLIQASGHEKAGLHGPASLFIPLKCSELLDLFVQRVTLEMRVVLLLLDTLSHGFLVPESEITGDRLALFFRFSAFQRDEFLHGSKWIEGSEKTARSLGATAK
jgi:hypothetical protein